MELLKEIGLSKVQAKIYLELLALKKARVMDIHRETKIARSNIYHNLEKLKKQKLVKEVTEGKQKFFCPENPRLLLQIFSEKEKLAKDLAHEIGEEENGKVKKPIRIYSRYSPEAHIKVWDMILREGKKGKEPYEFGMRNYLVNLKFKKKVSKTANYDYLINRIRNKIFFHTISSEYDAVRSVNTVKKLNKRELQLDNKLKDVRRILPNRLRFYTCIVVIGDLLIIFSILEEDYILVAKSIFVPNLFRNIFNYFWKRSKKPEEIEEIKNLMVTGGGIEPPT